MKYFIMGILEFRSSFTTSVPDEHLETYDKGRDFAHKITLRVYDER